MQPLLCSAFQFTESEIYALKDDERGMLLIMKSIICPNGRGPTEILTLCLPTPEIAPGIQPDSLLSGNMWAQEGFTCAQHSCHMQQ